VARKSNSSLDMKRLSEFVLIAANLGVLVSLVVLIFEFNQSQRALRAQTRHEISQSIVDLLHQTAQNQQLSDVLRRGEKDEALTPTETFQFNMRANALLRYWEDSFYQNKMGAYDQDEFDAHVLAWRYSFDSSVGLRRFWCAAKGRYSPDFAAAINRLLKPDACTSLPLAKVKQG
jgi:hypothetical protein